MERAERTGLGISVAAHVALIGVLSIAVLTAPKPLVPSSPPIDVQIVDRLAPMATTPEPAVDEPAPSVAPEVAPPEPSQPDVATRPAEPSPKPALHKVAPQPAAKPQPPTPVAAKPPRGSRLGSDFLKGIADRPSAGTAQASKAVIGPAVQSSLAAEMRRQIKPHWSAPSGADAEALVTKLTIRLTRDGTVASIDDVETTGQTDSNAGQVRLHQEAARKAVRLASPFRLPAEFYDAWSVSIVRFDKRLSQ